MSLMKRLINLKKEEKNLFLVDTLEELILTSKDKKEKDVFLHTKFYLSTVLMDLGKYNKAIIHLQNVYYSSDSLLIENIRESSLDLLIACYKHLGIKTSQYKAVKEKEALMHSLGKDSFITNKELASIYLDLSNYKKTEFYLNKSLKFKVSDTNKSIIYTELTKLHIKTNSLDKAKQCLDLSNDFATKSQKMNLITYNKFYKGQILKVEGSTEEAITVFKSFELDLMKFNLQVNTELLVEYFNFLYKVDMFDELKVLVPKYSAHFENEENLEIKQKYFKLALKIYKDDFDKKHYYISKLSNLIDLIFDKTLEIEESLITKIDEYSDIRKNEDSMNNLIKLIEKVVKFKSQTNNQLEFRDVFMQIVNYSQAFIDFDQVSIIRINEFDENINMHHFKKGLVYDRTYKYEQLKDTIFSRVISSKQEILLSSYIELIDIKEIFSKKFLDDNIFNSLASFPIFSNNNLIGVIAFYSVSKTFTTNNSTISTLRILTQLFSSEMQHIDYVKNERNIKNIYELSLQSEDNAILYTSNFSHYDILKTTDIIDFGGKAIIKHVDLLSFFTENSSNILNFTINEIKDTSKDSYQNTIELYLKNNSIIKLHLNAIKKHGQLICASLKVDNITKETATLDEIKTLAYYDNRTGIKNNISMNYDLKKIFSKDINFTLMVVDLNKLKYLNDKYGHSIGDGAIKFIAKSLKKIFEDSNDDYSVYRTGGDEFTVILKNCTSKREINSLLKSYQKEISTKFSISVGESVKLTVAIGIARYPTDTIVKKGIWDLADYAMYAIKRKNKLESDHNKFFKYYEKSDYATFQKINLKKEMNLFDFMD